MSRARVYFNDCDFDVQYDYQPEEKEVRHYGDGTGYPGCAEELELTSVQYNGFEWVGDLSDRALGVIENLIKEGMCE